MKMMVLWWRWWWFFCVLESEQFEELVFYVMEVMVMVFRSSGRVVEGRGGEWILCACVFFGLPFTGFLFWAFEGAVGAHRKVVLLAILWHGDRRFDSFCSEWPSSSKILVNLGISVQNADIDMPWRRKDLRELEVGCRSVGSSRKHTEREWERDDSSVDMRESSA
jgi:hypothetical protein